MKNLLEEAGYGALYKTKTREGMGSAGKVDGCALFYRKSRMRLVSYSELELNEAAAMHHAEGVARLEAQLQARPPSISPADFEMRRTALDAAHKRLLRDNIAQVVVLSVTHSPSGAPLDAEVPLLVVNTHLFWDPQYADVKLWQAAVLVRQVEAARMSEGARVAAAAVAAGGGSGNSTPSGGAKPVPLLLCGDLNSEPSSAVYKLLAGNTLTPGGAVVRGAGGSAGAGARSELGELPPDPSGVLAALAAPGGGRSRLAHGIPLASLHTLVTGAEPPFTNLTRDYVGTLDYVWASTDSVRALSAVEIPSAEVLTGGSRHMGARRAAGLGGGAFEAAGGGGPNAYSGGGGTFGGAPAASDEIDGSEGLPNGQWPSDHLPLVFEVVLEP